MSKAEMKQFCKDELKKQKETGALPENRRPRRRRRTAKARDRATATGESAPGVGMPRKRPASQAGLG